MNIPRLARMLASYVEARGVDGGVLSVAIRRGVFLQEGGGQATKVEIILRSEKLQCVTLNSTTM